MGKLLRGQQERRGALRSRICGEGGAGGSTPRIEAAEASKWMWRVGRGPRRVGRGLRDATRAEGEEDGKGMGAH